MSTDNDQLAIADFMMDRFGPNNAGYDEAYKAARRFVRIANSVFRDVGELDLKNQEDAKGDYE